MSLHVLLACASCGQPHRTKPRFCTRCSAENSVGPGTGPSTAYRPPPTVRGSSSAGGRRQAEGIEADEPEASPFDRRGPVASTEIESDEFEKLETGIKSLDRTLSSNDPEKGPGAVIGGAYMITGQPGAGKSTLALQALAGVAEGGEEVCLYVSGEETAGMVGNRCERLGCVRENLHVMAEKDVRFVEKHLRELEPICVVIDSVQAMRDPQVRSATGSVPQAIAITKFLISLARELEFTLLLICQINKEGDFAGPKALEHEVDAAMWLDKEGKFRTLRYSKNRFGPDVVAANFEMCDAGLVEPGKAGRQADRKTGRQEEKKTKTKTPPSRRARR